MATCMRCNTEITADNYDMNWTLMCNSCHSRYSAKDTVSAKVLAEREACAKIGDFLAEHTDSDDRRQAYIRMTRMIRGRSLDS
jgi:ribosomal protein S27AE